jgi:hypothetical protein
MIGAYDVDTVVLLRARPIINITTSVEPASNLQNIDPSRVGCAKHPNANHTWQVNFICWTSCIVKCFSFVAYSSSKIEFCGTFCEFRVTFCNSAFVPCTLQEILMLLVTRD